MLYVVGFVCVLFVMFQAFSNCNELLTDLVDMVIHAVMRNIQGVI